MNSSGLNPMSSYRVNRQWSDQYIDEIKRIVGPHLLNVTSFEVDTRQAADLVVMHARGVTIACRVRRPGYLMKYRDEFTIRSRLDSGATTELSKIYDGWADLMFYGHAAPGDDIGFSHWMLISLDAFRAQLIRYPDNTYYVEKDNRDGTHFAVFNVNQFTGQPPLLVARS